MINLLLFIMMGTRLIQLDANILSVRPKFTLVQFDGSILMGDGKKLLHFDNNGKLLRTLDGAAEGSAAIPFIDYAVFDGARYYVQEITEGIVHIFNQDGNFLSQQTLPARKLLLTQQELFMIDLDVYRYNQMDECMLVRLTLEPDGHLVARERFYPIKKLSADLMFNFKHHDIIKRGDVYYAMDELGPEISQFSSTFQRITSVTAQLPGYIPPKCCIPDGDFEERSVFINSQSYIKRFVPFEDGFAIAYSLPDPTDPTLSRNRLQWVDLNGTPLAPFIEYTGTFIGSYQNALYFLKETTKRAKEVEIWTR